ncbi:MAG TPA: AsmA-like C-terminal region-containing protein, partial [Candidatus Angelobacter sp.]|nr:AsmA-like C-terminal region-containing protein [Candidatus Angelobacter sp.]
NGHWNLEPLLLRAEQIPSAPTSQKRAEGRPRFPYIEASGGRINLKIGPEKKPYALTDTDFAFWLPSENQWHVRLEGQPMRTDMNSTDTGTIKLEGDLKRSQDLRDLPIQIQAEWKKVQLGQLTSLVLGQDKDWRGSLDLNAQLTGSLADLHLTVDADLRSLRRYDIKRDDLPALSTHCQGEYTNAALAWNCNTPVGSGGLLFSGHVKPGGHDRDCSLTALHLPLATLAMFARQAQRTLPDDVTATGELNAAFACQSHQGSPIEWHGTGATSSFLLQSSAATKPFLVSAIQFQVGAAEPVPSPMKQGKRTLRKLAVVQIPAIVAVDPFSIQLGPSSTLQAQGEADGAGYQLQVSGPAPLDRLLALAKSTGLPTRISNTTGAANLDLTVNGTWASSVPPKLGGHAHLQNVSALIPGVKQLLLISAAEAQFTDAALVLDHIAGHFENSAIVFTGSTSHAWNCQGEISCPLEFDLHADSLSAVDAGALLGLGQSSGWSLPFFSGSSNRLPDFRARGTVSLGSLKLGDVTADNFSAHVEVGDHVLIISKMTASIAGGTVASDWRADWSVSPPRYSGTGTLTGVSADKLAGTGPNADLLSLWVTGRNNIEFSLQSSGGNQVEILSSATGKAKFSVANGTSRALLLDSVKPLRFQSFQGELGLDRQVLTLLPSKLKADKRIYTLNGTVSLADKTTNLKADAGSAQWDIIGALDKPTIVARPLAARETH